MNSRAVTAEEFLSRLEGVRKGSGPRRWMARCPAHVDKSASLSIREMDDGRVLLHCFGQGCEAGAIAGAVGVTLRELFPRGSAVAAHGKRSPPAFMDMVRALELDALMVAVCAAQLSRGEPLTDAARARLREGATRILRGLEACRHG